MSESQEIDEVLFEAAMGIESPAARRAFLEVLRKGDSSRSARLGKLLEAQAEANRFYRQMENDRTVVAAEVGAELARESRGDNSSEASEPGERIGRYRLIQRIGEGGCGVVYLAEQVEPVQRHVALKVIRLGMDTERVIARFEMERQSLAMMDHVYIAKVLDAGATEAGRPYFVMEWVRGLRITDYCDEQRLELRARIDLFIEVCKAIQHAHQKGVIHRDIKPSNILVAANGKPVPKVIDFGVAKAIGGSADDQTALTLHDQFVGTPAYMSPEQADEKNQDIDTRSDVYSLGILLYELLVGRGPFDSRELATSGVSEMRRILIEREPPIPSALLAGLAAADLEDVGAKRQVEPARLVSAIKGDLDSVIMRAIEKDRRRRYETVNGLIMDLQRYLAHEPVLARPQSRLYLFGKFVRRNRVAVGATTGIVASLLLGLGLAWSFYLRERKSREEQVRLREVAEAAHAREEQRLVEAQQWEKFAAISMLLSAGKTDEADEKLRQTPLSSIQLSAASADVVRSLGNWNALRGRWQQASECFLKLIEADQMSSGAAMANDSDLLAIGTVLAKSGDAAAYARFREWSVGRFGSSSSHLVAARMLHSTLLGPADEPFLAKLDSLKAGLEASEFDPAKLPKGWPRDFAIWRSFSLALLEYRRENFQGARAWAERAVGLQPDRDYISATIRPVLAMALHHLGDVEGAKAQLARVRRPIQSAFSPELPAAYEPFGWNKGYWWDWVIARDLFREAEELVQGGG